MSNFWDYATSSALSLTISGNTGISPFLTLLLLGVVEISDPTLLNMGETMEAILASWYSIGILSILTLLEMIGKCVPAVDEIIDSVEVFIVPALSILGTVGTIGVFDLVANATTEGADIDALELDQGERDLEDVGEGFLTAWKVALVLTGMILSLLIHFFKMIIRISGLLCCAGCCQPCITVVEMAMVGCGVVFAIYIREIAVVLCVLFLILAGYTIRVKCRQKEGNRTSHNKSNNSGKEIASKTSVPKDTHELAKNNLENPSVEASNKLLNRKDIHIRNETPLPTNDEESQSATASAPIVCAAGAIPVSPPANNPDFQVEAIDAEIPVAIAVAVTGSDGDSKLMASPY